MNWRVAALTMLAFTFHVFADNPPKSAECLTCHDDKASPFQSSVHGSLSCNDCHTTIKSYPHPSTVAAVKCEGCHSDPVTGVHESVHAKVSEQPCKGCHGDPHTILPSKDPKSATYPSNLPRTCGACHGDPKFAKADNLSNVYAQYMDSIHGFALTRDGLLVAASCSSCHGSHKILSKTDPNSRTNRLNIAATCGSCHAGAERAYLDGIHGQRMQTGDTRAPVCTNCHTAHQVTSPESAAWQMKTAATCGACHQENYKTYHDTFHAQVSALGYVETAHCWDCHGFHNILPATDARSSIAPANLQKTCGKCHSGVNAGFVSYQPHADKHKREANPALWATGIFMNLLLAGVLGFFALHTLLWLYRGLKESAAHGGRTQRGEGLQ